MSDPNLPWEQQPLETDKAFAAFALYRDAGHARSVRRVAQRTGTSHNQARLWYNSHRWLERIRAYTQDQDRLARTQRQADFKKMGEDHLHISKLLLSKGLARLVELAPEELKPGEAARFIQLGVELEQRARGYAVEELSPAQQALAPIEMVYNAEDKPDTLDPVSFEDALRGA